MKRIERRMKFSGICLLLAALTGLTYAQGAPAAEPTDRFHVRGVIRLEGKPLAGVAVGIREVNTTTFTNADGSYDLYPVKRGQYRLALVHPLAKTESLPIYIKRDFSLNRTMSRDITTLRAAPAASPFFAAPSSSYDTSDKVSKAVSVFGLSPQYYTFLPSVSKMGVLFEPPVIRSQNPMNNAYVVEGLVMDMPFHSLGLYGTANLRQAESVSVHRGVYSVAERDAQGAGLVETRLTAGRDGRNAFDFYITPLIADAAAHYQIQDKAWGSVAVRRTIIDLYVAGDTSTIPAPIDYQTKNVYRFDKKNYLEVVAIGADDAVPLTSTQTFGSKAHAQKIRFEHRDGSFIYSLDLKNRYYNRDFVVISEKKQITGLHPQVGFYFAKNQFVQVGVDLFYESRSAKLLQGQSIAGVNLDELKAYNVPAGYDSGGGINLGGFLQYRGRFGKAGAEATTRIDKYREYASMYAANSLQLFYEAMPNLKLYVGGANMHKRPDPYKSISLLSSPALAPESNYKAELGASFNPFSFLKLQTTVFYTRWNNLIQLRSDTASITDTSNTSLYQSGGSSENTGFEAAAILQWKKYYLRSSYTYQHMPTGDSYSFYYRRHIANAALIYVTDRISQTVQLKIWSLSDDVNAAKSDALNPVVQLDYRWSIQLESGFFFTAEIGQILNLPWIYLAVPRRTEYNEYGALGNSLLGATAKGAINDELPIHLNFAAGVRL